VLRASVQQLHFLPFRPEIALKPQMNADERGSTPFSRQLAGVWSTLSSIAILLNPKTKHTFPPHFHPCCAPEHLWRATRVQNCPKIDSVFFNFPFLPVARLTAPMGQI
jgi:hypothetical protein